MSLVFNWIKDPEWTWAWAVKEESFNPHKGEDTHWSKVTKCVPCPASKPDTSNQRWCNRKWSGESAVRQGPKTKCEGWDALFTHTDAVGMQWFHRHLRTFRDSLMKTAELYLRVKNVWGYKISNLMSLQPSKLLNKGLLNLYFYIVNSLFKRNERIYIFQTDFLYWNFSK